MSFAHLIRIGDEYFNPGAIAHILYQPGTGLTPSSLSVLYQDGTRKMWTGLSADRLNEIAMLTSSTPKQVLAELKGDSPDNPVP